MSREYPEACLLILPDGLLLSPGGTSYDAYKDFAANSPEETLSDLDKRHLMLTMRSFRRSGLDLPQETRDKMVELKKQATKLTEEMDHAAHNEIPVATFSRAAMGIPFTGDMQL